MSEVDKPYKNLDELIYILTHDHALKIDNLATAKKILAFVPYYDLINGYKDYFMDDSDKFKEGITLSFLYYFHMFDRGFQNILFEFSVIIESYYKIALARIISEHIGYLESDYLNPNNYLDKKGKITAKKLFHTLQYIRNNSTDNPCKYYRLKHNHVPPWILLKNTSFSNAINLFSLLPRKAKDDMLGELLPIDISSDQKIPLFIYNLTLIRRFRNVIAHNLKFTTFSCNIYGKNLNKTAIRKWVSQELLSDSELKNETGLYGVYGYIYFSLSIIPDITTKLRLCHTLGLYTQTCNNIVSKNKDLYIWWDHLRHEYFTAIGIPDDFTTRISEYVKHI